MWKKLQPQHFIETASANSHETLCQFGRENSRLQWMRQKLQKSRSPGGAQSHSHGNQTASVRRVWQRLQEDQAAEESSLFPRAVTDTGECCWQDIDSAAWDERFRRKLMAGSFECSVCGKQFGQKSNCERHKQIHTGEKTRICDVCGKAFSQKSHLDGHRRTHTGERPFVCDTCGSSFSVKGNLETHVRIHSGETPFQCHKCYKTFGHPWSLAEHLKNHSDEKPFKCQKCDYSKKWKSDLAKHSFTHTNIIGPFSFQCPFCHLSYKRKRTLNQHLFTHVEQPRVSCGICARDFLSQKDLVRHKCKPSQCDWCGKAFVKRSRLNSHLSKHTGEKPHRCVVCSRGFRRIRRLRRHLLGVSLVNDRNWSCRSVAVSKRCPMGGSGGFSAASATNDSCRTTGWLSTCWFTPEKSLTSARRVRKYSDFQGTSPSTTGPTQGKGLIAATCVREDSEKEGTWSCTWEDTRGTSRTSAISAHSKRSAAQHWPVTWLCIRTRGNTCATTVNKASNLRRTWGAISWCTRSKPPITVKSVANIFAQVRIWSVTERPTLESDPISVKRVERHSDAVNICKRTWWYTVRIVSNTVVMCVESRICMRSLSDNIWRKSTVLITRTPHIENGNTCAQFAGSVSRGEVVLACTWENIRESNLTRVSCVRQDSDVRGNWRNIWRWHIAEQRPCTCVSCVNEDSNWTQLEEHQYVITWWSQTRIAPIRCTVCGSVLVCQCAYYDPFTQNLPMPHLWQGLQAERRVGQTHVIPHWRETSRVSVLWQTLSVDRGPDASRANSHRRKTLSVQPVPIPVYYESKSWAACQKTHGWKTFGLPFVWFQNCVGGFFEESQTDSRG